MFKDFIKKILPVAWLSLYHKCLAVLAAIAYRHPSDKMTVIGVTGTKGKTTTCNILWHLLEQAGYKTGMATTANFRIHDKEWPNKFKMTMLGRFKLQKLLNQMVKAGCQYAIIETSSEGIKQWRHYGINYDIAVFLNLSPEHIESHGSYENYRQAKGELFRSLTKKIKNNIQKIIIVNQDDKEAGYFLSFPATVKITYGTQAGANIVAKEIKNNANGVSWKINNADFFLKQIGSYNIYNALPAVALGLHLGLSLPIISEHLARFPGMPGRMELIDQGQNFRVIVDYAYEPKCLEEVLKTIKELYIKPELNNKIIAVSGPTGGGRDKWRRPVMGEILSKYCGQIIITTDDPYNDDPNIIADEMIKGIKGIPYEKIIDRREAIKKAFSLAKPNDIVLLAGKGSDPVIAIGRKYLPWDDREVARQLLCG
jgi:UDP-N-acetylmuramoyl-L-alanyl-D-glutamate--2,6-diaminopimelate ligase